GRCGDRRAALLDSEGNAPVVLEQSVALVLYEGSSPVLNACGASRVLVNGSCDDVEATTCLVEADFVVSVACTGEGVGAPLDVEDPVRCATTYRGVDTAATRAGACRVCPLVLPERHDRRSHRCGRQTRIGECSVCRHELRIAVR